MRQLFARKPITELLAESDKSLRRVMGAGDLIMLAIGAVIGAGIFSSLGTAAAGEVLPNGEVVRYGAGPALVFSFLLLGAVCALAGLCYAELAAMIPQAGSAYAYSYATLGELVAWIIGWDLILEYAVGNIAVAIAWSGYFTSLLSGFGIEFPAWLTHGYRTALLSSNPEIHGLLQTAPRLAGIPILLNIPAAAIVMAVTWLLYLGVKESTRANNVMVVVKLLVLGLFVVLGAMHIDPANYKPFAPNGWTGIHQGAAIVFFAYIGFDAISTAAEETKNPQRNMPIGILGGLAICTLIYVVVGIVATGLVPYQQLKAADPLARALEVAGLTTASWIVAAGAVVSLTAVLLVFQYGQPRIFFAMARDGLLPQWASRVHPKYRTPHITTVVTGVVVALGEPGRRRERDLRPHEHRHAVRVRDRLHRRARAALQGAGAAASVHGAVRVAGGARRGGGVHLRDGRPAAARPGNASATGSASAFSCISSTATAGAVCAGLWLRADASPSG